MPPISETVQTIDSGSARGIVGTNKPRSTAPVPGHSATAVIAIVTNMTPMQTFIATSNPR